MSCVGMGGDVERRCMYACMKERVVEYVFIILRY